MVPNAVVGVTVFSGLGGRVRRIRRVWYVGGELASTGGIRTRTWHAQRYTFFTVMVNDDWQSQMERYLAHFNRAGKRQTILFTQSVRPTPVWTPALDMYETQDAIVVLLDLAGVDAELTEVHTQPHLLTVRGARRERHGPDLPNEERTYHALEIPYGRFERTLRLPPGTDTDAARASYRDGLLEITLPKRVPNKIPVAMDQPVPVDGARS